MKDNVYKTADVYVKAPPSRVKSSGAPEPPTFEPYLEVKLPAGSKQQTVIYLSLEVARALGRLAEHVKGIPQEG